MDKFVELVSSSDQSDRRSANPMGSKALTAERTFLQQFAMEQKKDKLTHLHSNELDIEAVGKENVLIFHNCIL